MVSSYSSRQNQILRKVPQEVRDIHALRNLELAREYWLRGQEDRCLGCRLAARACFRSSRNFLDAYILLSKPYIK